MTTTLVTKKPILYEIALAQKCPLQSENSNWFLIALSLHQERLYITSVLTKRTYCTCPCCFMHCLVCVLGSFCMASAAFAPAFLYAQAQLAAWVASLHTAVLGRCTPPCCFMHCLVCVHDSYRSASAVLAPAFLYAQAQLGALVTYLDTAMLGHCHPLAASCTV